MGGVTRNVRTYGHFCMTARALERVGERWNLLVVRDLLSGPKRFTDLIERLGGITPKTLSVRLHELEDIDVVTADRKAGRREVWYRLTPAGAELGPIVDGLGLWAMRNAWRFPQPGEPLHAEHLLRAITEAINAAQGEEDDHQPALWHFRLEGTDYLIESDGHRWTLEHAAPSGPVGVMIDTTTAELAKYVFNPDTEADIHLAGDENERQRFRRTSRALANTVQ